MVAVLGSLVGKQAGQLRDKQDILQDGPQALLDRQMDRLVRAMDKVLLGAMELLEAQLECPLTWTPTGQTSGFGADAAACATMDRLSS